MTSPQPADQRVALQRVTAASVLALSKAWQRLPLNDAEAVRDRLLQLVPLLSAHYGDAARALAADLYAILRDSAGVRGAFTPELPDQPSPARLEAMVRWGVDPLFSREPKPDMALYRVSGGLQKTVADDYRATMQLSALADPQAEGWQREARADGCPFCVMLAGRGAVYSKNTVDFGAHRDCHCIAVPAFHGQPKPVRPYTPSSRNITAADRARVRRWIAQHQ